MDKINLPFFYHLGTTLNPVTKMTVAPDNRLGLLMVALEARDSVNNLLTWSGGLSVCRASAQAFVKAADDAFAWWIAAKEDAKTKADWQADAKFRLVVDKAKTFETVLSEELATLSTYSASKKGAYSTSDLIEKAENVLSGSVSKTLNEEITEEVREAGKCLAFDIPTACAFHMLRATEGVLHEYYLGICKPVNQEKLDNWGAYISALYKLADGKVPKKKPKSDQCNIDVETKGHVKKVLALLQLIKDQDRNLIMHPEVNLTNDEAFTLFEITKSAIMTMVERLPSPPVKISGVTYATLPQEAK